MMRSVSLFFPALLAMMFLAPFLQDLADNDRQSGDTGRSDILSDVRRAALRSGTTDREPAIHSNQRIHSGRSLFFQQVASEEAPPTRQSNPDSEFPDGVLIGTLLSASQPLAYIRLPSKQGIIVLRDGSEFASNWVVSAIHADSVVLRAKSDRKVRVLTLSKQAKEGGRSR